jgi:hypothetical protein
MDGTTLGIFDGLLEKSTVGESVGTPEGAKEGS